MPDLILGACRTRPLLPYLKALGILRAVAGVDLKACLWWNEDGTASLRSRLANDELVVFFLEGFSPSPITSPWNKESGYFESVKDAALTTIEGSTSTRLAPLRETIISARSLLSEVLNCGSPAPKEFGDLLKKPELKRTLLEAWRAVAPEAALPWLDATVALGVEGPAMNPILGTGGLDSRLEFSNNYCAHLIKCLPELAVDGGIGSRAWLGYALFGGDPVPASDASVGMFDPASAGLPNSSSLGSGESLVNPWDFVLMLEGALLLSGGVARTLAGRRASFPFTVRHATRAGTSLEYGSDADMLGETWLPIWNQPASFQGLKRLFAEGRIQDGRRQAVSGRDSFRGVSTLGVDRGVTSFERVVYSRRFGGRMLIAVPMGQVHVRQVRELDLTREADHWLARARKLESNAVGTAVAAVERAELQLATGADSSAALERWLLSLADLELVVARIPSAHDRTKPGFVPPLTGLPAEILTSLPDCVELRLAAACASIGRRVGEAGLRSLVEPVEPTSWGGYAWAVDSRRTTPLTHPIQFLAQFATSACAASGGTPPAAVGDVAAFLDGAIDDGRLVRLAHALTLCSPVPGPRAPVEHQDASDGIDRLFVLATLVASGGTTRRPGGIERPITRSPEVIELLAGGRARDAARVAWRRLQSSELAPVRGLESLDRTIAQSQRIAAALCFPLGRGDRDALSRLVLRPERPNEPFAATATIPPEEPTDD